MKKLQRKKGNEMQIARGRLKGALQEAVIVSDDDDDTDKKSVTSNRRGRPPKTILKSNQDTAINSNRSKVSVKEDTPISLSATSPLPPGNRSNVMIKLFDRNLNLSIYDEHTPLYPICHDWLLGQPKSGYRKKVPCAPKREEFDDIVEKVLNEEIKEIDMMPKPKSIYTSKCPSPTPEQKNANKSNLEINSDSSTFSKEDLLEMNKKRWLKVRKKWLSHYKSQNENYAINFELLDVLKKN